MGLGALAFGTTAAAGLALGAPAITSAWVSLLVGVSLLGVSAYVGLFPTWQDERHSPAVGGLVLAVGGFVALAVGYWLRGRL